jgi:hypothetical protein
MPPFEVRNYREDSEFSDEMNLAAARRDRMGGLFLIFENL